MRTTTSATRSTGLQRTVAAIATLSALRASAADPELTNYKSGIDVTWGGTKGTAYQEEYWFHDKRVLDTKQVWLRDDTPIAMGHNERNVASTNGRPKVVIGADGGGTIRYKIDKIWQEHLWAPNSDGSGTLYPAHAAPFTLASQNYEPEVPVCGTTGGNGVTPQSSASFYWRGMLDAVGDEWHVLSYADDDSTLGGWDDSWASDGKWVLLVVNPKTPALTVRTTGSGQFYTTPAWTYWTHKIHAQTTYFQGTCTFELHDLYGNNVHYRINGGGFTDAGAPTVTLNESHFVDGTNSLEYYYAGHEAYVRTRTVVENPTHPGRAETHGQRVFGWADSWDRFARRVSRAPYAALLADAQTASGSGQANWDVKAGNGLLFGGSNWPHSNYHAGKNAITAHHLGMTATRSEATKSYAQYAKEMLLESPLNQAVVGFEASFWASMSIPGAATVYRGYWDVNFAYSDALAYDVLMDGYRSDQVNGGITPVEDYFIRDSLASWVHLCGLSLGGFAAQGLGMWSTSRNVGATMITCVLPNYSTPYYGTSGMDGNATVHPWAPFETHNYTWKDLFLDLDNPTHAFTTGPFQSFGMEGSAGLIRPAGTPATRDPSINASWVDKTSYASMGQCGHSIYTFANLIATYGDLSTHAPLLNYLKEITEGSLYGNKTPPDTAYRQHAITVLNERFPQAFANAAPWVRSLPDSDPNSVKSAIAEAGLLGAFWYDEVDTLDDPEPAATPVPRERVISFWSGEPAASGNRLDEVGSNHLGYSPVGTTAAGKLGIATDFTGANYLRTMLATDTVASSLTSVGRDLSWAGWIRFDTVAADQTVAARWGGWAQGREHRLYLDSAAARLSLVWANTNNTARVTATDPQAIIPGQWYFVAYGRADASAEIWLSVTPDGNAAARPRTAVGGAASNPAAQAQVMEFGANDNTARMDGQWNQWGAYRCTLTAGELDWLFHAGAGRALSDFAFVQAPALEYLHDFEQTGAARGRYSYQSFMSTATLSTEQAKTGTGSLKVTGAWGQIQVFNNSNTDYWSTTDECKVSTDIYVVTFNGGGMLFQMDGKSNSPDLDTNEGLGVNFYSENGNRGFAMGTVRTAGYNLPLNRWVHLTYLFRRNPIPPQNALELYADGVLIASGGTAMVPVVARAWHHISLGNDRNAALVHYLDNFSVTASGVASNTPPLIADGAATVALTTPEGTPGTAALTGVDADGDLLSWSIQTQGARGTASVTATGSPVTVTYVPAAQASGSDTAVVVVADGKGGSDTITVNVTLTAAPSTSEPAPSTPVPLDIHAAFNHDGVVSLGECNYCGWYATHDPLTGAVRTQVGSGIYGVLGDHLTSDSWTIGRTFAEHPLAINGDAGKTGLPSDYRIGEFEFGKGMTPPAGYNRYGRATWSAGDWPSLPVKISNDLHFSRGTVEVPLIAAQRAKYARFNILFTTWRGTMAATYTARVEAKYAGADWATVWQSVVTTTAANQPGGSFATGYGDGVGYNGTWQDSDGLDPNAFGDAPYLAVRPVVAFTNNRFIRNAGSGSTLFNALDASNRYLWTWDGDAAAPGNQGVPLDTTKVLESLRFTATSSSTSAANRLHLYAVTAAPLPPRGTFLQLK